MHVSVRNTCPPPSGWPTVCSSLFVLDEKCKDTSGHWYTIKKLVRKGDMVGHAFSSCKIVDADDDGTRASTPERHLYFSGDDSSDESQSSISCTGGRADTLRKCSFHGTSADSLQQKALKLNAAGGIVDNSAHARGPSADAPPPSAHHKHAGEERSVYLKPSLPREFNHASVPKLTDFSNELVENDGIMAPTTVMIRNIPNRYKQCEMMREIDGMDLKGTYNFFYLPIDSGTLVNVGYAFVNFVDSNDAKRCMDAFHNHNYKRHNKMSQKVAAVSVAHIQGFDANVAHYSKCRVRHALSKEFRPVVLPFAEKSSKCP